MSWERIHIYSGTWRQTKESVHALKTVQQAVWEGKRLTIVYKQANGELRNYRVSRIHTAKIEDETFRGPLK